MQHTSHHYRWTYTGAILLLLAWQLLSLTPAAAAPVRQDDPVAQCAEGVRLFFVERYAEALPLLEAGYAGRAGAVFSPAGDESVCALALGYIRVNINDDYIGALVAYEVGLDVARRVQDQYLEATALRYIADVYTEQGRNTEALTISEQALPILQALRDSVGESSLLRTMGTAYRRQGRYSEALTALQQSLTIQQTISDLKQEGYIINAIGEVYVAQGRYVEAMKHYQQALAIAQELGDRWGEANTLDDIGLVYQHQGQYAEALAYYQQALKLEREVGDRAGEGTTLDNLGLISIYQGQYATALGYHQQALEIARTVGDQMGEGIRLNNLGLGYHYQGQYTAALDYYQQALELMRAVGDRAGESVTLNNLGGLYGGQGQYATALDYYQQALEIARAVGDRKGEGTTLNNLGAVYQNQGQYAQALKYYQQALEIARAVGDRKGEGTRLNNLGAVYHHQGQDNEALETYQQALAIQRAVGDRAGEGQTLRNLGLVYHYQEQYTTALEYYQQALAVRQAVGDRAGEGQTLNDMGGVYHNQGQYLQALEYYQQALAIQRAVGDWVGEGHALNNLGAVCEDQGQYDQALTYYEQALDVLETVRATAGGEQARAGFIAQYAFLYTNATHLYHDQGQDDEAFRANERSRARAFLDSLATGYVQFADNESQELFVAEQESYAGRQAAQDALAKARAADPPDAQLIADLEQQLAEAEQAHDKALKAIESRGGQLAALVPARNSSVLGVAEVQQMLPPGTTLVSYFVGKEQTLAFIVAHDTFTTVELPVGQEELRTQVEALRAFPSLDDAQPPSPTQLYDELIAPLKQHLTTPHLAIIPHSVLHYLPFAALSDGEHFLIDDYTLSVLPSASSLPFIQQNAADRLPVAPLVLGNPASNQPDLKPLAAAEDEARAIAGMYDTSPLLGAAASESALASQASGAGIVHMAAHASFNPVTPLASAIYLAPASDQDGQLEVGEIYSLDLHQADLVVLSACETQIGELSAGDELVGMTRALVFAGTPSVIATLWSVDDQPTALLMERFYTHLRAGNSKAEALRQAQIEVRQQYPSPYYWAGFVLSGDPGQSKPTPIWPWIAGGGLLGVAIIGGGLLIWHRARRSRGQPLDAADGQSEAAPGTSLPAEERGG